MNSISQFFLAKLSIQGKQGGWRAINSSQANLFIYLFIYKKLLLKTIILSLCMCFKIE
jgi:hypothetical protein